jgi:hypothetical protein
MRGRAAFLSPRRQQSGADGLGCRINTAGDAFRTVGSVAGFVSLALAIWLSLRALGLLAKPKYRVSSAYVAPAPGATDAIPHFIVRYENTGNTPVTFSDFELLLPRKMFRDDDVYVFSSGAELFIDKRRASRVAGLVQFEKSIIERRKYGSIPATHILTSLTLLRFSRVMGRR